MTRPMPRCRDRLPSQHSAAARGPSKGVASAMAAEARHPFGGDTGPHAVILALHKRTGPLQSYRPHVEKPTSLILTVNIGGPMARSAAMRHAARPIAARLTVRSAARLKSGVGYQRIARPGQVQPAIARIRPVATGSAPRWSGEFRSSFVNLSRLAAHRTLCSHEGLPEGLGQSLAPPTQMHRSQLHSVFQGAGSSLYPYGATQSSASNQKDQRPSRHRQRKPPRQRQTAPPTGHWNPRGSCANGKA